MTQKLLWLTTAAVAGTALGALLLPLYSPQAVREPAMGTSDAGTAVAQSDWEMIRRWLEQPAEQDHHTIHFRIFRPAVILPSASAVRPRLPADTTITITRRGDQPAHIAIRQGERQWEMNENDKELEQLPPALRNCVDLMLGPWRAADADGGEVLDLVPEGRAAAEPTPDGRQASPLHRQVEQMNQQMEQLRRQLDDLQEE